MRSWYLLNVPDSGVNPSSVGARGAVGNYFYRTRGFSFNPIFVCFDRIDELLILFYVMINIFTCYFIQEFAVVEKAIVKKKENGLNSKLAFCFHYLYASPLADSSWNRRSFSHAQDYVKSFIARQIKCLHCHQFLFQHIWNNS